MTSYDRTARNMSSRDLDNLQTSYHPFREVGSEDDDEDAIPPQPGFETRGNPIIGGAHHHGDDAPADVIIHTVPSSNKSRWSHIDDLDSFFKKVYQYHQKHGFKVMMAQEFFMLSQFAFIVGLATVLLECVNYQKLFQNGQLSAIDTSNKITLIDCIEYHGFSLTTWVCLLMAAAFWTTRVVATFYHFFQYWEIKSFYNVALQINDGELDSITWPEVQRRVVAAQKEYLMCIHKEQLTELDIYHRILRFKNYMVAMMNKDLLPVKIDVPFLGEKKFFSHGLKFNLEFLFFKGPWAPFNQWHLKDDYKKVNRKQDLVEHLQGKITLLALVNFMAMPLILAWQLLYCFFNYAELIKREPSSLGVRKWSHYAQLYLRHFNELDHELKARLNKAYKPANMYMELFVSPMSVVIAQNIQFVAGSLLGVLFLLTVWDEDVLNVEHVLTYMSVLGLVVAICRVFIPDENMVFAPEKLLSAVLAHIHYFPENWRGEAHTQRVMSEMGELFPYTAIYLLHEVVSPIVTPFILFFHLKPKAGAIVDFFRNFTVDVVGVGDVCSFAQMDVRRHGNPTWQHLSSSSGPKTTNYTQAEDGKTEMSLVNFSLKNPDWRPPLESEGFISAFREQAIKEAEAMPTLHEENLADNALYSSLTSLEAAGGVYSEIANNILQQASVCKSGTHEQHMSFHQYQHGSAQESPPMDNEHDFLSSGAPLVGNEEDKEGETTKASKQSVTRQPNSNSLIQSTCIGLSNAAGRSSLLASSQAHPTGSSLFNSRLMGTTTVGLSSLAPPPNLKQDLKRLGLEYCEADMSFSALYLHHLHENNARHPSMNHGNESYFSSTSRRSTVENSGYPPRFESMRHASLNELDEENVPLIDTGSSPRISSSMKS